ncbi:hypothetical protein MB14_04135 [Roseivirga ehrenbergii]|uniref:histidine kinase n=2 Tax=Roseivirga ehrenbergii (strain DSM 102268 / JCM 13514 / KCTC 12282 / NCIMB 14502 / KMM 6017) TaxID=279360 RepID=A0A150X6R6_ROSEK|nr:hypothetical protein MB14_04135 [Roseivirga ehrenbergii]
MYIANVTGVIEFDGQNWRVDNRISDDSFKDVVEGPDGRIYATSKAEFGYFSSDLKGELKYTSLVPKTPSSFINNGSMEHVDLVNDKLIFKAFRDLLIYDPVQDTITVISNISELGQVEQIDGKYYAIDQEKGLVKLDDNRLVQMPLADRILQLGVIKILRFANNELLFVTRSKGLFKYDFETLVEWDTEVSDRLKDSFGYTGLNIQDKYYAFGTDNAGVFIIDAVGKLVQKLDKTTGLPDFQVMDLELDSNYNLWVIQHGAINQVILNSPITSLDERHGVNGYVLYISEYNEDYYVATTTGMAYKSKERPWQSVDNEKIFTALENYPFRTWMFFKKSGDLLAATNTGLLTINKTSFTEIYKGEALWAGAEVPGKDQMIIGSVEGHLHLFEKQNDDWKYIHKLKGFEQQMDFLEWDESGDFWMTDSGTGVFKLTLNEAKDEVINIKSYGKLEGLPDNIRNRVFRHSDGLKFGTDKGVYTFDSKNDRFNLVSEFSEADSFNVFRFIELANGNIFASLNGYGKGLFIKNGEEYKLEAHPYQRIISHNSEYATGLGGNDIWITSSGIKHVSTAADLPKTFLFNTKIRQVRIATNLDSVIFGGGEKLVKTTLSPDQNALNFSFSASFYDALDKLEFQSQLVGSEEDWSNWSSETVRTFTNLPYGSYTFKVRAKNVYGEISEIDEFSFKIETPFYFTFGAFVFYTLVLGLIVWFIVKTNNRKLIAENEMLEHTVKERTSEIREQKEAAERDKKLIQEQADKLRELDKVKSRFFANISHELRTPLTLINAPLEALIADESITDERLKETLNVAQKNGERLNLLVEEILDLAKVEAGKLKLVENPMRVKDFLEELLMAYTTAAQQKEIEMKLCFQAEEGLAILCDGRKCSKILNNLLSNAIKYTPLGGIIRVEVATMGDKLIISVVDNGDGIHPNDLPKVFDRFYQSEQPDKKAEGGTGIGLALAKELAVLHGGDLKVQSTLGEETKFTFTLPLKRVSEKVLVPLTKLNGKKIEEALKQTIDRYSEQFNLEKPVLLVTEDHPEMRAFVAKTLQPYFAIIEANNGKKALEILLSKSVDIVISDVMMPIMDGFELLEAIKKDEKLAEVSVVMLTARADTEDKLQALTLGIDDYLTKPFSAAEFLARIKNILENRIKVIRELRKIKRSESTNSDNELGVIKEDYGLTNRETEILKLLSKRYSNQEISDALFVSTNTVKYHLKSLYLKLGVANRTEVSALLEG